MTAAVVAALAGCGGGSGPVSLARLAANQDAYVGKRHRVLHSDLCHRGDGFAAALFSVVQKWSGHRGRNRLRFYDASTAGNQILVDSHTLASGGQVAVSNGLFNVTGDGTIHLRGHVASDSEGVPVNASAHFLGVLNDSVNGNTDAGDVLFGAKIIPAGHAFDADEFGL